MEKENIKKLIDSEKKYDELNHDCSSLKSDVDHYKLKLKSQRRIKNMFIASGVIGNTVCGAAITAGISILKNGSLLGLIPIGLGIISGIFGIKCSIRATIEGNNERFYEELLSKKENKLKKQCNERCEAAKEYYTLREEINKELESND